MIDNPVNYVAVEGTVCAGKTTLCNNVKQKNNRTCIIPDYSDFAGGGKNLPPPFPATLKEESDSLHFFLDIEKNRFIQYDDKKSKICLIDRSVYTLLAHCYSITKLSNVSYFDLAKNILFGSSDVVWPSKVLYLDISHSIILNRNNGKFAKNNIFINDKYNQYFKEFFFLAINSILKPIIIDGEKSKSMVCFDSIEILNNEFYNCI